MASLPRIEWACQHCGAAQDDLLRPDLDRVVCRECSEVWELRPPEGHVVEGRIERCRFCGSGKLFVQKSFNRAVGLALVVAGAAVAILLGIYVHPFLFAAVLVGFIAVDALLFALLPLVDVCYRCRAVYHGAAAVEGREGFDLELAEWNERQFTLERDHRLAGLDRDPAATAPPEPAHREEG